jgi:predicted nucleic acid-binding protein
MMTVCLDVCCLNRPFDDQTQARIRMEAEAVLRVLASVLYGEIAWITSEAVQFEVSGTPDVERRARVTMLLLGATRWVSTGEMEAARARDLADIGFSSLDALHIACAESGKSDVLLTTDDRLIRQAERHSARLAVRVENPLAWIQEVRHDNG